MWGKRMINVRVPCLTAQARQASNTFKVKVKMR